MKKIISWLKSAKSDFILLLLVVVLANLVGSKAFFRLDITAPKAYSLSKESKILVQNLEEPLAVKVFFTENLPAPYNNVEQYVQDILLEYDGAGNDNFSYEFYDMNLNENLDLAHSYGLRQVQIQEVKNNEVGFKHAYMGIVLLYGDKIEVLDGINSSNGLEYKLTSQMGKMISTVNALAGLQNPLELTLYLTEDLANFNISGFNKIEGQVRKAFLKTNAENQNKLTFTIVKTTPETVETIAEKYGFQKITWEDPKTKTEGKGIIGLVLSQNEQFKTIPLSLARGFFGFAISGLDSLEENLEDALQGVVSQSLEIGYITGHGERALDNPQEQRIKQITADVYELKEINLAEQSIPASINTVIINGPQVEFNDKELYALDQFLLGGGKLILFIDPFIEMQQQNNPYAMPTYLPVNSGLEKLLTKYGLEIPKNYVLDEACFESVQQGLGKIPLYFAPVLQKSGLNQKNAIGKNLGNVIMLNSGSINLSDTLLANKDIQTTIVAQSSPKSWLMKDNINLNPMMIMKANKEAMKSENLAVLLEGNFTSAFDTAPEDETENFGAISATKPHLQTSIQKGSLLVFATSHITSPAVIDDTGNQGIAYLVRNAIDYMNNKSELAEMRTKGLTLDVLKKASNTSIQIAKIANQYLLPLLVVIIGLIVWHGRTVHRRKIRKLYASQDTRETDKEFKTGTEKKANE